VTDGAKEFSPLDPCRGLGATAFSVGDAGAVADGRGVVLSAGFSFISSLGAQAPSMAEPTTAAAPTAKDIRRTLADGVVIMVGNPFLMRAREATVDGGDRLESSLARR
jgi:hypothetical protein